MSPEMKDKVAILAASYNGAGYLAGQLDSLFAQTWQEWHLHARDDASTDHSLDILSDYSRRYADRISVQQNPVNLGAIATFNLLLHDTDADWVLLCDQDDVWLPGKVEKTLALARDAEQRYGKETPLLVHTDLKVVDTHLKPIADSLWRYQRCDPGKGRHLNRLLLQNAVTGCSIAINRSLRDLALPIPTEARMHDWWLALCAAAFGQIVYLDEPTVLYRQHGVNAVGAQPWGTGQALGLIGRVGQVRQILARNRRQGAAFLERFRDSLAYSDREMTEAYATLGEMGFIQRRLTFLKYGFSFAGWERNLGLWLFG